MTFYARRKTDHRSTLPEGWPFAVAHRGASTLAPENTLAAFSLARSLGCRAIELDVHLCRTGELVVTHDHWLDRVSGIHARVENLSFADLESIDAGSFFNVLHPDRAQAAFSRERIPTLDAVLEETGPDMCFDIELKTDLAFNPELARATAECLARHRRDNCIVSSFNPFALLSYRSCGPHATAAIYCPYPSVPFYLRHRECLRISGADIKKPAREIALGSRLAETGSKPVLVWTVDSADEAQRLRGKGVAGIITNRIQDFVSE